MLSGDVGKQSLDAVVSERGVGGLWIKIVAHLLSLTLGVNSFRHAYYSVNQLNRIQLFNLQDHHVELPASTTLINMHR